MIKMHQVLGNNERERDVVVVLVYFLLGHNYGIWTFASQKHNFIVGRQEAHFGVNLARREL